MNLMSRRVVGLLSLAAIAVAATGCGVGDGSDIGPALPALPSDSCKVVVLDDTGRGVTAATVTIGGARARTGRNGRGDLFASPRGRVLVDVDAEHGAAVSGDRLGRYTVATSVAGPDLPAVLYVPEFPLAASALLTPGTQSTATVVTSAGGSSVTVPAGGSVGAPNGAVSVRLQLGELQASHLPGDLPGDGAGALTFGRGLWIDPAAVTFAPGLDLDVVDDLGDDSGAGAPRLFRLDATTGEWGEVVVAVDVTGGRLRAAAAVDRGGCYAFAAAGPAVVVSGRVVDVAGNPIGNAMVSCDQRRAISDGSGRFTISGIGASVTPGVTRAAVLTVFAGGSWLPARSTTNIAVGSDALAVGDVVLDTLPAGDIRMQQIVRGRANEFAPAQLSSQRGDVALVTTGNADGQAIFEEVPAEFFGFQDGRPLDAREVLYGQSVSFLDRGRRRLDVLQFQQRRAWYQGARRSRVYVSDAIGGGPLTNAFVISGATPGSGLVGETRDGATVFAARDFSGRATATRSSTLGGQTLVHAFSIVRPDGDNLELPLRRLLRPALGAFDRHGLVGGTVIGADPARSHALVATRRLSLQEWWADVVDGVPIRSSLPIDVDPALTHAGFTVGVDVVGGNVAVVEFTSGGSGDTPTAIAIAADITPREGELVPLDLELAPASTTFVVAGALVGLAPEIQVADLRYDLALRQPSGRVVDVARGLGGLVANGDDLQLQLPALVGALVDHEWLLLLRSSSSVSGIDASHASLCVLRAQDSPAFRLPQFPAIVAPAPALTVAASGFTVQFTLPPGAVSGTVELRSTIAGDERHWQAVVPPNATEFTFVDLPTGAPDPLVAGRSYTLTVTASFGAGVLATVSDPYRDFATFWQSIGAAERGVVHVVRRSLAIVAN